MLKKSLVLGAALALAASSLSAPSFGEGGVIKVSASIDHQFKFGAKKPKHQSTPQRTAQGIGYTCRNGLAWCRDGFSYGIIGTSCCGCGFCGWWSTW